jgi:toxin ParE1/3/4
MRIRWTELAARDFAHICDYTEKHEGPRAARRVALKMHETIGWLVQFPHRGRPGRKSDTRELIFTGLPFLAIYRLREDVIEINRILHGAQKWP